MYGVQSDGEAQKLSHACFYAGQSLLDLASVLLKALLLLACLWSFCPLSTSPVVYSSQLISAVQMLVKNSKILQAGWKLLIKENICTTEISKSCTSKLCFAPAHPYTTPIQQYLTSVSFLCFQFQLSSGEMFTKLGFGWYNLTVPSI